MISELTDENKIKIKKMLDKPPKTEAMIKRSIPEHIFNSLLENGFLTKIASGKGKKPRFEFTEKAKETFSSIIVTKKTSAKKRGSAKSRPRLEKVELESIILDVIRPLLNTIEDRLNTIEKKLDISHNIVMPNDSSISFDKFISLLKLHYTKINTEERRGGMVPIPRLWDILKQEGVNRKDFEEGLFELERRRTIELQIASDPNVVKEPEKGIHHPSRGLIHYIIWRR